MCSPHLSKREKLPETAGGHLGWVFRLQFDLAAANVGRLGRLTSESASPFMAITVQNHVGNNFLNVIRVFG
jgi:hypothetical protein